MNWNPNRRSFGAMIAATAGASALGLKPVYAETIKVAGIYTQPIQQKWDARLHQGLEAAKAKGEIEYVFSEKVANTDYIRVLREYCESGVKLIVGEAFGISKEARKVADEYPDIAFLMGDPFEPHGSNFLGFRQLHSRTLLFDGYPRWRHDQVQQAWHGRWLPDRRGKPFVPRFHRRREVGQPDIQYKVTFIGSWYDPPKAKEAAFAQIEAGADVLYAERAGVVDAARDKGIIAFGNVNDMNKEENGTDVVVTSALWHMEEAIANAIAQVKAGSFKAENYKEWTMMRKGGASLAPYYEFDRQDPS